MSGIRRVDSIRLPDRKRQRLSSPTYDEQLPDVSQDDLAAFDEIEARFSQGTQSPLRSTNKTLKDIHGVFCGASKGNETTKDAEKENIAFKPSDYRQMDTAPTNTISHSDDTFFQSAGSSSDLNIPSVADKPIFTSANFVTSNMLSEDTFTSPAAIPLSSTGSDSLRESPRSPSPVIPPERDYSSWFESAPALPAVGFQTAKFVSSSSLQDQSVSVHTTGFMKASNSGWIAPSVEALAKAEEKIKIWQDEVPEPVISSVDRTNDISLKASVNPILPRPVLGAVENSFTLAHLPDSPSPASFGNPSNPHSSMSSFSTASSQFKGKAQPFKSPLMPRSFRPPGTSSPEFSPLAIGSTDSPSACHGTPHAAFNTPVRPSGLGGRGFRNTVAKPKFVTPFKEGMKPGEPGRKSVVSVHDRQAATVKLPVQNANVTPSKATPVTSKGKRNVFDLSIPQQRQTLASSGLMPQAYSSDELEAMGINAVELDQISPALALYYSFHTASSVPLEFDTPSVPVILGPSAALDELLELGCTLATKPWVDNHWCLILWKMAGMACLDPQREGDPTRKIWCWGELMRQLRYRYERELNGGSRPPLRRIATRDSPPSLPMVLCVSNVTWSEAGITDDGLPIDPQPELEVTDGWYRLRAKVDKPLTRAIRRGIIRVGRKIAVAGARLWSERKEPGEVLESYNSIKLVISGNSSHLAPWHAKLGFQTGLSISTLHSLTPDGGIVSVMDVVVLKMYPIAFIEFFEEAEGKKRQEGPRNESEEVALSERWKKRREVEESKLRDEFEKRLNLFEDYASRLERRAGSHFKPGDDDSPPDHIEDLYDELTESTVASAVLGRLNHNESGWLARYIRDQINKDREMAGDIFEKLTESCPPRDVRDFRVLVVQDACTQRRPANRIAQLTVWDVQNLTRSEESSTGTFEVGQRFRVTNLMPTQQSAWMDREAGSEIYLSTRRDSKWARIP